MAKLIKSKKIPINYTILPRESTGFKDSQCVFSFEGAKVVIQMLLRHICQASNNPKFVK